eukprot:2978755-Heterocapsa_arctica.AAC.1
MGSGGRCLVLSATWWTPLPRLLLLSLRLSRFKCRVVRGCVDVNSPIERLRLLAASGSSCKAMLLYLSDSLASE